MQTFLPYSNFKKSLSALDDKRLGKQRVEAFQILKALKAGPGAAWYNHPAVQMWKGYEELLKEYHNTCIKVWVSRGFENNMEYAILTPTVDPVPIPWWLGVEKFHRAMRARLIHKNPVYYDMWPEDEDFNDSRYWWPVNETKTFKIIIPKSER